MSLTPSTAAVPASGQPAGWSPLPDAPAFPAAGYAPLADAVAGILGTAEDVLLVQGEAVVALEAAASSLGRPGLRVLNLVSSMYGRWLGHWLRRSGAEVQDLEAPAGLPLDLDTVRQAIAAQRPDLVALVHAESAYGILNPLQGIAEAAKSAGALLLVDAVASVGGHPVAVDALGIDLAVIGPQKALGGQAGVSALSVSAAAWERIAPAGPAPSILSLADQRQLWLDTGRGTLPGTPSALEFHALAATLERVRIEGMPGLLRRHAGAAAMARAGVLALAGRAHVAPDAASNLVTALPLPPGLDAAQVLARLPAGHALSEGVGPAGDRLIRLNHTGPRASASTVLSDLHDLGRALRGAGHACDPEAAVAAAAGAAPDRG